MSIQPARNIPTVFVIFGATGDLTSRKIIPALFRLFEKGQLPNLFSIIGFSRRPMTSENFREMVNLSLLKNYPNLNNQNLNAFLRLFSYHQGSFENLKDYHHLAQSLGRIDNKWQTCSNKLFYTAVPPHFYKQIFKNISASGLTIPCGPDEGWTRVLVEKPFGKNYKEAKYLDHLLSKLFLDEQIYRIDHYLAKEMLQNILMFRFANNLLERAWNRRMIEKIDIKLLEKIDLEGRGAFYDGVGALLDVGQNHLLQMLALITMDNPIEFTPQNIRRKRSEIINQLAILNPDEIKNNTIRGQYCGYKNEKGVKPNSATETYFKIKTFLNSPRWHNIPITIESGKKLPYVQKEIIVTLKHSTPCLCPPTGKHFKNRIHFYIQPKPGIAIKFWSKAPDSKMKLEEQWFNFDYSVNGQEHRYLEEYAKLIQDVILGDQTLFVSSSEAVEGWKFIDPIVDAWQRNEVPLEIYDQNDDIIKSSKRLDKDFISDTPTKKEIGIIGLGKMGRNLALRFCDKGWKVTGFNRTPSDTKLLENTPGFTGAYSLSDLVNNMQSPRIIWLMLPAGKVVDEMIDTILKLLKKGDYLIEGGNSFFEDTKKRYKKLARTGIKFIDVGVSGGPNGARYGPSLMVGGKKQNFDNLEFLFSDLASENGYEFFEGQGAGHFVKMVHNGIEYGMMQSIAEGFNLLKKSPFKINLDRAVGVFNHGSVIESKLIGWLKVAFSKYGQDLHTISGSVHHSGEGAWTVKTAQKLHVPVKSISDALLFRIKSQQKPSYLGKILSAMRGEFGQHEVNAKKT